jgi:hypothetical protein
MSKTRVWLVVGLTGMLVASLAIGAPAASAKPKFLQKTYTKGVGGSQGGVPLSIPDGAGPATQIVRSAISVRKLNPRGKITDVNVGVRATHPFAADLEFYLASPRGVIGLSSDNGGNGNNYGGLFASCAGQFTLFDTNVPTLISTPGLQAPFAGSFAPEESLALLNGLVERRRPTRPGRCWSKTTTPAIPSAPSTAGS